MKDRVTFKERNRDYYVSPTKDPVFVALDENFNICSDNRLVGCYKCPVSEACLRLQSKISEKSSRVYLKQEDGIIYLTEFIKIQRKMIELDITVSFFE